ncbi:DUF3231 family protein [Bacillus lacus]|uniref:DUF3231 family protein n=1 Tax=Metabacillus lacus TaxID=1983721 RepID=A0A7X2IZ24_9BACI|nr:DUF3231 family protein [Metabacillus lacus]MRX72264.1 DUF3231 family protein [Metabacillus lacus]
MPTQHSPLSSSEIAAIWTTYLQNSMADKVLAYFLKTTDDEDVKQLFQHASTLTRNIIQRLEELLKKEDFPLPIGFQEDDVDTSAGKHFTDAYMLTFLLNISRMGLLNYSAGMTLVSREDVHDSMQHFLTEMITFNSNALKLAVQKGIYMKKPFIPYPSTAEMISSEDYFSGLNPLKKVRPLNAIEIAHLSFNIENNHLGLLLSRVFAETAKTEEVKKYMHKGKAISKKHVQVFQETLLNSDIAAPMSGEISVINGEGVPFSEKLMMFLMAFSSAAGIGNYSAAGSASQRIDVAANYSRLAAEIGMFAKEGADITVKYGWLEKPPTMESVV